MSYKFKNDREKAGIGLQNGTMNIGMIQISYDVAPAQKDGVRGLGLTIGIHAKMRMGVPDELEKLIRKSTEEIATAVTALGCEMEGAHYLGQEKVKDFD